MERTRRISEQGSRQQTYGLRNGVRLGQTAAAVCHMAKEETNQQKTAEQDQNTTQIRDDKECDSGQVN